MMNQTKTGKAGRWKVATFLPLLALLLMAFGRTGENEPPEQAILSPLEIAMQQDSVKQWKEADFKVFTSKTKEEIFFSGKTFVIVQIDADSRITVNGESLTIHEIPGKIQKWLDYQYADQKEHFYFEKHIINGQTKMSPTTIITVRKDTNTPQDDYLKLLNAVANTVLKVRGDYSNEIFKKPYTKLSADQRKEIDKLIPMNVEVTKEELKKFETATPPPLKSLNIEIRKDGNYIDNRLFSLEEIRKKAEAYQKSNANAVVRINVDKDVPGERIDEIKEILSAAKVLNINLNTINTTLFTKHKPDVALPPPPPPNVINKGLEIFMDGEDMRINNQPASIEELEKMISTIKTKNEFVEIHTSSATNKTLETKIKELLEQQKVSYRINWSSK